MVPDTISPLVHMQAHVVQHDPRSSCYHSCAGMDRHLSKVGGTDMQGCHLRRGKEEGGG